jgi:hypothetical protein
MTDCVPAAIHMPTNDAATTHPAAAKALASALVKCEKEAGGEGMERSDQNIPNWVNANRNPSRIVHRASYAQ